MKLTYQTSIATLIQFITLVVLNIGTGAVSVVTSCSGKGGNCVSNLLVSLLFFLLICVWFGAIWILGYLAQDRRNKRLAQLLIIAEVCIAAVALFNIKHHSNLLSLGTSIIDFGLCVWVITLAYRLMKSGGGRIVTKHHPKQKISV
jgi:hypothetical protein